METEDMNRREFLKSAITVAALAPMARFAADARGEGSVGVETETKLKVTRRPFKDSGFSLPLLGFGLMRLPQNGDEINMELAEKMIRRAMECGVNYFDTAYMYHRGRSEVFAGEVLSKYPRESYYLTSKMPIVQMKSESDNERIFNEQLKRTRAGYFDFYFMHWLNKEHWDMAKRLKTLDFMKRMKAEGKIRRIGFSYHGEPEQLKTIAEAYPWDLVQIQLNYVDWVTTRAGEQYDVLEKLGIPVSIMEPLKGGALTKLPQAAVDVMQKANPGASQASWGLRYAASLPGVAVVLSGMSDPAHVDDNIRTFSPFKPLTGDERNVISAVLAEYRKAGAVPCTSCKYCAPCPAGVDIPRNLAIHNQAKADGSLFHAKLVYDSMAEELRASSCVQCGACARKCPQKLGIPALMKEIAAEFA